MLQRANECAQDGEEESSQLISGILSLLWPQLTLKKGISKYLIEQN